MKERFICLSGIMYIDDLHPAFFALPELLLPEHDKRRRMRDE